MRASIKCRAVLSAAAATAAVGVGQAASAAVFQWDGGGANTSIGTVNNWNPNTAPVSNAQNDFEFGSIALVPPNNTTVNNTTNDFNVNSITFNGTAGASFSLTGSQYDFQKDGTVQPSVIQNSSLNHSIANNLKVSGDNFTLGGNGSGLVTISGQFNGGKPLIKSGTSTYLLTGNNNQLNATTTINGGTIIVGHVNALDTNMAITVNNAGTLAIASGLTYTRPATWNSGSTLAGKGTYNPGASFTVNNNVTVAPGIGDIDTFAIATATTFGAGGRFSVDVSGGSADRLNVTGNLNLNATSVVQFNVGSAPTLGRYRILDYSGTRTGTFGTVTTIPTNYALDYNNTDTAVDLRRFATIGTISATPADAVIITGGTTAVSFTVQNSAPTDSFDLVFSAAAGSNMTGAASGTVAANATGGPSSNTLAFNGTTVGLGQTGAFSLSAASQVSNSPQNGGVSVDVLAHSNGSFSGSSDADTLLIDFGTVFQNAGGGTLSDNFAVHNLPAGASPTAGLDLDSFGETGDAFNKFSSLDLAAFVNLAAGGSDGSTIDFDTTTLGTFSATYTINLSDQDLPGATGGQTLTLNLTGTVVAVPEPTMLGLLGVGALATLPRRRWRRASAGR